MFEGWRELQFLRILTIVKQQIALHLQMIAIRKPLMNPTSFKQALFYLSIFAVCCACTSSPQKQPESDLAPTEESVPQPESAETVDVASFLATLPQKTVPWKEPLFFEKIEIDQLLTEEQITALQLQPVFLNVLEEQENVRAQALFTLDISRNYRALVLAAYRGEYELFGILATYDLENQLVDQLQVGYSEIAEGFLATSCAIERDQVLVFEENHADKDALVMVSDYQLLPTGEIHGGLDEDEPRYVENLHDYDWEFLEQLMPNRKEQWHLVDSMLIDGEGDTAFFPIDPPKGKRFVLTGRTGERVVALTVERINYTSIEYRLEFVEFGKSSFTESGTATLHPRFYLGAETFENTYNGTGVIANQFTDIRDAFEVTIKLGRDGETPYLLGEVQYNTYDSVNSNPLEGFPTLVEK